MTSGSGGPSATASPTGLADIYRYFRDAEPMLTSVLRDADAVPAAITAARIAQERGWQERLTRAMPGRRRKTVQAAVAHATSFATWRSLCVDLDLANAAAVDLMVAMTAAATDGTGRTRDRS